MCAREATESQYFLFIMKYFTLLTARSDHVLRVKRRRNTESFLSLHILHTNFNTATAD